MNLDKALKTLEAGFANPDTIIRRIDLTAADLSKYELRGKKNQDNYRVWMLSVGEVGQNPVAWFIHHKLTVAMKMALTWRGVPTIKRARKVNGAAQPQPTT